MSFGKDLGLLHQTIVTLQKAGTPDELRVFFARIAESEALAKKVLAFAASMPHLPDYEVSTKVLMEKDSHDILALLFSTETGRWRTDLQSVIRIAQRNETATKHQMIELPFPPATASISFMMNALRDGETRAPTILEFLAFALTFTRPPDLSKHLLPALISPSFPELTQKGLRKSLVVGGLGREKPTLMIHRVGSEDDQGRLVDERNIGRLPSFQLVRFYFPVVRLHGWREFRRGTV